VDRAHERTKEKKKRKDDEKETHAPMEHERGKERLHLPPVRDVREKRGRPLRSAHVKGLANPLEESGGGSEKKGQSQRGFRCREERMRATAGRAVLERKGKPPVWETRKSATDEKRWGGTATGEEEASSCWIAKGGRVQQKGSEAAKKDQKNAYDSREKEEGGANRHDEQIARPTVLGKEQRR